MKTALQKLVEKTLMLERNQQLNVCMVGEEGFFVGIGSTSPDDFSFVPLAKVLTRQDLDNLEDNDGEVSVDFGWSACVNVALERVRKELKGCKPDDFQEDVQHPALTQESIDDLTKYAKEANSELRKISIEGQD
tara:strand:- start:445 stop:846 length:402 start_codon:yes stop_codon:yes gene_type:complete